MQRALCVLIGVVLALASSQSLAQGGAAEPADRLSTAKRFLDEAIVNAGKRLQRKECAAFLGPNAVEALNSTDYRVLSFGTPVLREGRLVVTAAETTPNHKMVLINLDGPFVSPRILIGGKYEYFTGLQPLNKSITLSDIQIRVLIVLHELGHVVGKFGPDTMSVDESQRHTDSVIEHCL
jgi:hypothetical protein